ncbi:site-specific integrase [Nitratifractor sp.]
MAIVASDYLQTRERNIKRHKKDPRLFLFDFRIQGKRYRKHYKVKATNHSARDNLKEARLKLEELKEEIENGYSLKRIRLDDLFKDYMETQPSTAWTHKKAHIYDLYIGDSGLSKITRAPTEEEERKRKSYNERKIGQRFVDEIKPMHIERIISAMEKKHGLSPRSRKGVLEVMGPLLDYAVKNGIIKENPAKYLRVKVPSQKKVVTNATELFRRVYSGIVELYADEPFYKALFLFGFTGRRKSEILNLKWENIDFGGDYYWIEYTKNGEKQKFPLPAMIKAALLEIPDDHSGLVFKSPKTGKQLSNTDRQMRRLREHTGVENLTLHYMRNILVSALAEQSTEAITLSGILGHRDINTINKYLSNSTMKSGLKGLEKIEDILEAEVVNDG